MDAKYVGGRSLVPAGHERTSARMIPVLFASQKPGDISGSDDYWQARWRSAPNIGSDGKINSERLEREGRFGPGQRRRRCFRPVLWTTTLFLPKTPCPRSFAMDPCTVTHRTEGRPNRSGLRRDQFGFERRRHGRPCAVSAFAGHDSQSATSRLAASPWRNAASADRPCDCVDRALSTDDAVSRNSSLSNLSVRSR
jgi:hypothetical protein